MNRQNGKMYICHRFLLVCVLKWVNSGEIGPYPPVPTGELFQGPSAVCPPCLASGWSRPSRTSWRRLGALGGPCSLIKLDWSDNTDALYKKSQSRLFLLRRPRSFRVEGLLRNFYSSVVAPAIVCGVVSRTGSIFARDKWRIGRLGQLCPGLLAGHSRGGGRQEEGS